MRRTRSNTARISGDFTPGLAQPYNSKGPSMAVHLPMQHADVSPEATANATSHIPVLKLVNRSFKLNKDVPN